MFKDLNSHLEVHWFGRLGVACTSKLPFCFSLSDADASACPQESTGGGGGEGGGGGGGDGGGGLFKT